MVKKCFKCRKTKPVGQFYPHRQMADGYLGKCKACTKKDVSTRYYSENGRAKVIEYEQKRFKDPARKTKLKIYRQKRKATKPGKERAKNAVSNAIRDGRLVRKPCERCGNPRSQAHHDDYRRKLYVRWLCFKHHREEHGQIVT